MEGCFITGNSSGFGGGGVAFLGVGEAAKAGRAQFNDCVIRDNESVSLGGGCFHGYRQGVNFLNCYFARNNLTHTVYSKTRGGSAIHYSVLIKSDLVN